MIKISQEEILKLLEEKREPLTLSQICSNLNCRKVKISPQLKKLVHYNEISFTEINHEEARKYGSKRRMRLYYINNVTYVFIVLPVFIHFL